MGTKTFNNYEDLLTFTRASKGHALRPVSYGPELVANGGFDTNSDWTDNSTSPSSFTITSSKGQLTVSSGARARARQEVTGLTVGKTYQFKFTLDDSIEVTAGYTGVASTEYLTGTQSAGDKYLNFVALGTSFYIQIHKATTNGTYTFDNISVKEVTFDEPDGTLTLFEHPDNVPRVEWDADRNRLGLLVEESRTNSLTYSEDFSQWNLGPDTTRTFVDNVSAPDGTQGVYKFTSTGGPNPYAYLTSVAVNGQHKSIWARTVSGTGSVGLLSHHSVSAAQFDLTEEWQRFDIATDISEIGGGNFYAVDMRSGDLTEVYVWGAQLETGSFPTSYIKTTGATATRPADIADINTADFGYNLAKGTVVCEFNIKYDDGGSGFPRVWEIGNNASSADRINTYIAESSGNLAVGINTNSVNVAGGTLKTNTGGSVESKVAMGWAKNNFGVSDNGNSAITDVSLDILPTAFGRNRLKIGGATNTISDNISGHIKSIKYYPRRLTNAQLQALTEPRSTPTLSLTFDGLESSYTENYIHG